jgi:hypothetical protein
MNAMNMAILFGVLFGISEALALIPQVKSNSVFQLIQQILAMLAGKKPSA